MSKTINVSAVLDGQGWTGYQMLLVGGTALTIVLDGIDNQLLPNAVPKLMSEWHHDRTEFNSALSTGPFGMMIGGAVGGYLGDRIGRRTALLASVMAFALATLAIAWAADLTTLALLRFLAGIGLGGAIPNAAAFAAEYVPRRHRSSAFTLTVVCISVGGVIAAYLARTMIEPYGWRSIFLAGGLVPVLFGILLFFVLPESPRFLASRRSRWPELTALLRRMGHEVPPDARYVDGEVRPSPVSHSKLGEILAPTYLRDTLALCASFFFGLMASDIVIMLIPIVFANSGFALPAANRVLEMVNYGGVIGALIGIVVLRRFGSRVGMLAVSALAVVVSAVLSQMPVAAPATFALMTLLVVDGALVNGVQTSMYALAAHVYPTDLRCTGMGTAVAFGRVGNVLAPWVGNRALTAGGNSGYFLSWALTMGITLLALAVMSRHIPRAKDLRAAALARV